MITSVILLLFTLGCSKRVLVAVTFYLTEILRHEPAFVLLNLVEASKVCLNTIPVPRTIIALRWSNTCHTPPANLLFYLLPDSTCSMRQFG